MLLKYTKLIFSSRNFIRVLQLIYNCLLLTGDFDNLIMNRKRQALLQNRDVNVYNNNNGESQLGHKSVLGGAVKRPAESDSNNILAGYGYKKEKIEENDRGNDSLEIVSVSSSTS
jgi:hypothetical protein